MASRAQEHVSRGDVAPHGRAYSTSIIIRHVSLPILLHRSGQVSNTSMLTGIALDIDASACAGSSEIGRGC